MISVRKYHLRTLKLKIKTKERKNKMTDFKKRIYY